MAYRKKKYYRRKGKVLRGEERKRFEGLFEKFILSVFLGLALLSLIFSFASSGALQGVLLVIFTVSGLLSCLFALRLYLHRRSIQKYKNVQRVRDELDPWQFERWVAELLKKLGYKQVKVVGGCNKGDGGIDIKAFSSSGELVLVQVKKYCKTVSVSEVRDFMGAMVDFRGDRGIFVTTSYYSKGCHSLEKRHDNFELWDCNKLVSLID